MPGQAFDLTTSDKIIAIMRSWCSKKLAGTDPKPHLIAESGGEILCYDQRSSPLPLLPELQRAGNSEDVFERWETVGAGFFKITRASDLVWYRGLNHKMIILCLKPSTRASIESCLACRHQIQSPDVNWIKNILSLDFRSKFSVVEVFYIWNQYFVNGSL